MKLKIKCTNVYDGEEHVNVQDVDVPAPEESEDGRCEHGYFLSGGTGTCPMPREDHRVDDDDLNEWAQEYLMQFTGDGNAVHKYAGYFVEVLECAERPELVGVEVESYG